MKKLSTLFLTTLLLSHPSFSQLDSIYDQNVWRTFIVHLPAGYTSSNQYPIVLNLHGYNSNAAQQESYTQFDNVADSKGFIVVYPSVIANAWVINGTSDVDFLSHLVDTIRANYSCNNCLFSTGMSDGGFMTYKFACATSQNITAIAVGSGNMTKALQNSSASAPKIPVMHFHGTADPLVAYNGVPPLIPPVDSTIQWWVNHNNCNGISIFTSLPDINTADSSTVVVYYYSGGINGSEVTFYKVINGGHTWSGATPVPTLGNTNQDINQSAIIGDFFASFCSASSGIENLSTENSFRIYPNPAQNNFTIKFLSQNFSLVIYDSIGRNIFSENNFFNQTEIDCNSFPNGVYFINISDRKNNYYQKLIISR